MRAENIDFWNMWQKELQAQNKKKKKHLKISIIVQSHSRVQLCKPIGQSPLSFISPSLLKFMSTEWVIQSNLPSSATAFSFCLKSFPAPGYFPVCWLFTPGFQSIGVSASALDLPTNIQGRFPLGLTSLISLLSMGLSIVFSSTTIQKYQLFGIHASLLFNSHIHTCLLGKP